MEVVLPFEIHIPSLMIKKDANLDEDEWIQTRLDQINLIDEKRLAAVCHDQGLPQGDPKGKWIPIYEGPFVIKKIFTGGSMILTTMDSEDFPHPVNADIVMAKLVK